METQRPKIIEILRQWDDPAADQALVAGILLVNPVQQAEIASILIERGSAAGLRALVALFDKLDLLIQSRLVASTAKLGEILRNSIRGQNVHTRLNTIEIIRRSGNLQLAYLLGVAIHDGSAQVRAEASIALRHLANLHCQRYEETTAALREVEDSAGAQVSRPIAATLKILREERSHIVLALREAINSYQSHFRSEVLEAAMYLADELEYELFHQETLKRGKLTHAAMEIFTDTFSPRFAAFTYIASRYPELRRKIVSSLATHVDPEFFAELIRLHWLTRDPSIRKCLGAFRNLVFLNDGTDAAFSLPVDVAAKTPMWVLSLGIPTDQKVAFLLCFLLLDNVEANRATVWALISIETPASTLALQGLLDFDEPDLVRIAEHELAHRKRSSGAQVRQVRQDRPSEWAKMLDLSGLSEDFDDFWRNADHLHPEHIQQVGHHAFRYIPGFSTQVRIKLMATSPSDRLRAIRFICLLDVNEQLKNELFAIANDPVVEVRAAAMPALGQIGEATSRRILERAINDESPVVQAAAIGALDAMNAPGRETLFLPKAFSDDADTRAAAIGALLKLHVSDAAKALVAMLQDSRPEHRCAALWVTDELRISALLSRIHDMVRSDPDERIARIAEHVTKRLERTQIKMSVDKKSTAEATPS